MQIIRNGAKVQYRKVGKGIVRFHECPEGTDESRPTATYHRYLVHFYTGRNAGKSRQVWLAVTDVIPESR